MNPSTETMNQQTMTEPDIEAAAQHLNHLRLSARPGPRLALPLRPLHNEDAWRIQRRVGQLRGQAVRGWKCSVPNKGQWTVAALYELHEDAAQVQAPANAQGLARIEPEFGYVLGQDLPPRDEPYLPPEIDRAVATVHCAIEVLGCRYAQPEQASPLEHMADSHQHQCLVLGPRINQAPTHPDFELALELDAAAPRSHPARHTQIDARLPLYWLAEFLRQQGLGMRAGQVVITGSLAGALLLPVGAKAVLRYADLGAVSLSAQALHTSAA